MGARGAVLSPTAGPVFTTDRLLARPWTLDDADAAYEVYRHPEVTRWLGSTTVHADRDASARWLTERVLPRATGPDAARGLGFWALEERDGNRLIGAVLLAPLPGETGPDGKVEVGWHLHPEVWGRGYATEAGRGALAHGFVTVGLAEIHAVVVPANSASVAVTARLGMTPLGRTRAYYDRELELFRTAAPPS